MKQTPIARNPERIAEWQQRSRHPIPRTSRLAPVGERAREVVAEAGKIAATRRPETGFSRAVKLAVRTRAGGGDPSQARCEADGAWLGPRGGDHQHIVARGMGGCKDPLINSAPNDALLCRRCHDLAESRSREMRRKGFWLPQGTDPRTVPMTLWSGKTVWRSEDGRYLDEAPEGVAA